MPIHSLLPTTGLLSDLASIDVMALGHALVWLLVISDPNY